MKKLLLLFVIILNDLNAQWVQQTAPVGTGNLYSVFANSSNAVASVGFGKVLRTLNGGTSWTNPISVGNTNFWEVHSANPVRWYSLTQNSSWYVKMSLAGTTLQSGKPDSILSLHYRTMACAFAVGIAGKIESTCDTGATWSLVNSGTNSDLLAIWFADLNTGCAVGTGGEIRRTTNAGVTWTNSTSGTIENLNGIHFPSSTVGYIVGNTGTILKTTNSGGTWLNLPSGTLANLNGVFFTHIDTGYVVGQNGVIMKTVNGGSTWGNMNSGTNQTLNSVHFATWSDGWVVGNGAIILKYVPCSFPAAPTNTTNAGNTTICSGNSTTLSVTGAGNMNWYSTPSSTTVLGTGTNYITPTLTTGVSPATYTFYAEAFTCGPSITRTGITVTVNPSPTITISGGTVAICAGSSTGLTATGGLTYSWSTGSNSITVSVSPTVTTSYTVTGSGANGCTSSSVKIVTVNTLPTLSVNSTGTLICAGQAATLTATGANTYTWNTGPTNSTIVISPTVSTNYTVNGTDANGCNGVTTISITVDPCTGILQNQNAINSVIIFPNPVNDKLNINVNTSIDFYCTVEITDVTGKLVLKQATKFAKNKNEQQINISSFAGGVYFLKLVSQEGSSQVIKVVKE